MKRLAAILAALLVLAPIAGAGELPAPVTDADYLSVNMDEARLGQLLFYDPILSGNRNISCATCHHPRFATSDGLSLGIGEGGIGLGPARRPDPANLPEQRIPRNSTALFNLGAREFTRLFHDGRIEADAARPGGIRTPLDEDMTLGFSGVLAAQTMFPVLSQDEMAGHYGENDVSKLVRQGRITGPGGAWERIAGRVAAIPAYREMFAAAMPETAARGIAFTDIANAIAAFIAFEWRSDDSPFDAFLRGEGELAPAARRGMELFYGEAGCARCHSGKFQTDHEFHAMGVPQIGPGKAARFETHARDEGRLRVTGRPEDAYAFRTPSLRNATRTGPYGHDGAYRDLRAFLKAHLDPANAPARYDRAQAVLPELPGAQDWRALDDPAELARISAAASRQPAVRLSPAAVDDLLAFLAALEDPVVLGGRLGIPAGVPSGLPVER
ncbi:cytochrome c peroxidase [Meinhardsimonia xiamenensis]|jgi:cytochrome c peroxidase|uniref:Cytochrome c peroxidase n=1 Tax=Meinhardsimonia xiamenensis TaxID=990712 RepID=A0A1G9BL60_9RHOB|nr:cytochrome c peroxidase [Meinhardsimonia xiamenensis]PRX34944.1 cytochrome c peroxidase [Meinhardsimonia xiamenensis]SDK39990.1 cytochrome c peroxidase [Meinhardsimonia xiamenensis]